MLCELCNKWKRLCAYETRIRGSNSKQEYLAKNCYFKMNLKWMSNDSTNGPNGHHMVFLYGRYKTETVVLSSKNLWVGLYPWRFMSTSWRIWQIKLTSLVRSRVNESHLKAWIVGVCEIYSILIQRLIRLIRMTCNHSIGGTLFIQFVRMSGFGFVIMVSNLVRSALY